MVVAAPERKLRTAVQAVAVGIVAVQAVCGPAVVAVGRAEVCAMAVRSLRPRGRMVQIGLLLGKHADPVVPMGLVIARELRIIGSHGMAAAAYPEMLAMVADGRLRPERLMGRVIGFGEIPGALAAMTTNEGAAGAVVAAW